jgi:hypothetical protein
MRGIPQERVEAVAAKALAIQALTYKSIVSLLDTYHERAPAPAADTPVLTHPNVRGPGYFH